MDYDAGSIAWNKSRRFSSARRVPRFLGFCLLEFDPKPDQPEAIFVRAFCHETILFDITGYSQKVHPSLPNGKAPVITDKGYHKLISQTSAATGPIQCGYSARY